MFLNNAIHQFIKEAGIMPQSKNAADIIRQGMVSTPLHHANKKVILLVLEERYFVCIKYKNAFALDDVSCSCGKSMPCEHVMAALFLLVESEDKILKDTREIPAGFSIFFDETGQRQAASPLDEFRPLPISDLASYLEFLNIYKPPFTRQFSTLALEKIIIKNQNVLENIVVEKQMFQDDKNAPEHKVTLDKNEEGFRIKCHTCDDHSFSLCMHQYEVIKHPEIKSILLSGNMPDYEEAVRYWAKKSSVSEAKFKALYEVRWSNGHSEPSLVNNQFYTEQKLEKLQQKIEKELLIKPVGTDSTDAENRNDEFGNALLWSVDYKGTGVHLMKGKMDRLGHEFQSKIERADYPEYLPGHEKDLWYKIERFCIETIHDNPHFKTHAWNRFLKNIIGELNVVSHYVPIGNADISLLSKRLIKKIAFSGEAVEACIKVRKEDAFYKMKLWLKINGDWVEPSEDSLAVFPYFLVMGDEAFVYKHPRLGELFRLMGWEDILFDTENNQGLQSFLFTIHNLADIEFPDELKPQYQTLENGQWKIHMKEAGNQLIFTPTLHYAEGFVAELPLEKWLVEKPGSKLAYIVSETDVEKFMTFLLDQHEEFEVNLFHQGAFSLHYKDYLHENWFLRFFENCRASGIEILGHDELENFKMNTYKPSVRLGLTSGIDWFDVDVEIKYGDMTVSSKSWMDAMKKNEKYILLADGSLGMIPEEWFAKLKKISMVAQDDHGALRLNKYNFNIVETLFDEIEDDELYLDIKSKISLLSEYDFSQEHKLPKKGKADLREYQKLGYQWLKSLSDLGFGGCLADDMGLGKTIQVLTLLEEQKENRQGTSLIVVPRSLLFSWATEIEKFYPDLDFMFYHGIDRVKSRELFFQHDIIISTYDTVTNDIEYLKDKTFNYVILDESQAIKNPESKRYKAMRLLRSKNKIAITGTPIENNTFDLYAQFSFVNPGIFGSASQFRTNFAIPIDKENDPETAFMLRKIIHPFLLRRTKAQVASDLPDRTEQVLYCEMGDAQRLLYEDYKERIKSEIDDGIKKVGVHKMRIKVIEGLLRLRQICNSPLLLDSGLPNHLRQSVKIETLMDIIENDMGDHHALIYSQFTSMLSLVRAELDKRKIPYAYLDGSTRDRQQAVEYFMKNDGVKLFLISLKAGSTGLNLVKADYVYILDPWWNPAVEAQAIDRTHRIGQDKNVFAYKMICRDTIEEKIILLQEKKKQLATDLIITDEQVFKSLNNEDLISLFN